MHGPAETAPRRGERGLSLIEVILALGLMAAVLISIAGMFVISERQVASGKTATEALAVARTILEEIHGWGFRQTYGNFGLDGAAQSYTVLSSTNAEAARWQTLLDESLERGSEATILIESLAPTGVTVPNLDVTRAIRVTVTVGWTEAQGRDREVSVSTVRM
jgi:type II secretory pathway pseudopilin PulG